MKYQKFKIPCRTIMHETYKQISCQQMTKIKILHKFYPSKSNFIHKILVIFNLFECNAWTQFQNDKMSIRMSINIE